VLVWKLQETRETLSELGELVQERAGTMIPELGTR
jgi:hypothetical protein